MTSPSQPVGGREPSRIQKPSATCVPNSLEGGEERWRTVRERLLGDAGQLLVNWLCNGDRMCRVGIQ